MLLRVSHDLDRLVSIVDRLLSYVTELERRVEWLETAVTDPQSAGPRIERVGGQCQTQQEQP